MAKKKKEGNIANKEQNKTLTIMIALLIVVIWFAVFIFLIKSDVGGFGSGVLRPILKDVPVLNLILPKATEEQIAEENNYEYTLIYMFIFSFLVQVILVDIHDLFIKQAAFQLHGCATNRREQFSCFFLRKLDPVLFKFHHN